MSAKNRDRLGRWRNKTIAFRATPEESAQIDRLAVLSGMTKQDYMIHRLTNRDVVVMGNPRVYKALRNQMEQLIHELQRLNDATEINTETVELLEYLSRIYDGMQTEDRKACPQERGRAYDE